MYIQFLDLFHLQLEGHGQRRVLEEVLRLCDDISQDVRRIRPKGTFECLIVEYFATDAVIMHQGLVTCHFISQGICGIRLIEFLILEYFVMDAVKMHQSLVTCHFIGLISNASERSALATTQFLPIT